MIGLNGYGAEVAKNIILAGVKSVTFMDHRSLSALDACSQFLAPKDQVGKNVIFMIPISFFSFSVFIILNRLTCFILLYLY